MAPEFLNDRFGRQLIYSVADCMRSGRFARKAFICLYMGLVVCSSSQHTGSSYKV